MKTRIEEIEEDQKSLQKDIDRMSEWATKWKMENEKWKMEFNVGKCKIMQITKNSHCGWLFHSQLLGRPGVGHLQGTRRA
jgi:hypothetical protein